MIFVLSLDSKRYILNSGDGMPVIGIGTRKAQDPGVFREAAKDALVKGYRHIDT
jgi:diketogulonate reductase-like aldo/keto reductase